MPYKQSNSPFWWINKSFSGIGRIQRSTESKSVAVARQMEQMLDRLYSSGKGNFVKELRDGLFSLPWLYTKDFAGELDTLISSTTALPFSGLIDWVEKHKKYSPDTKRSYLSLARTIDRLYPKRSVHDMPRMLKDFREHCEGNGVTRSFNQTRALFQAYATAVEGKHKPLWVAIANVSPISYTVQSGRSLTYREVRELTRDLICARKPDFEKDNPEAGFRDADIFWSLLLTGMRKSEYLGNWSVAFDRVVVHNSGKSRQSGITERVIPRFGHDFTPLSCLWSRNEVQGIVDPGNSFQTFERRLRKATNNSVSPHDCRHTFRTWLLLAGVPEIRAEAYMGHKVNAKDVKKVYTAHDVIPHLQEDAVRLRTWLAAEETHWFSTHYEHSPDYRGEDDPYATPVVEYGRVTDKRPS
jgi:integrase